MDHPPGSGGDPNPSATNNAGSPQTRPEELSDTRARLREIDLRIARASERVREFAPENTTRALDLMEIDHEPNIPNSRRAHDQTAAYEGNPHRAAHDRVAGRRSPTTWDEFRGALSGWDSTDEESTEEQTYLPRSSWQPGPSQSRRTGPPTNPFQMEYGNGVPGPHSRVHADAHQVTPYGTPAHRPTLDAAAQRVLLPRSVAEVMHRESPDSGSSLNMPRSIQRTPPSFPPPRIPNLGVTIRAPPARTNRNSAQTHRTGTIHATPETQRAFEQILRAHGVPTNQVRSNPLNPQTHARNFPDIGRTIGLPVPRGTAERSTAPSGSSHTGVPPGNSIPTANILHAVSEGRASGMRTDRDRVRILHALATERAADAPGLRTRVPLPRSPSLDRDDGRPPPMSEEEMMMSVECKICYGQPISVAFMPCGESLFVHHFSLYH